MRRLLSFLCLFVIGWGSAWALTVPLNSTTFPNATYAGGRQTNNYNVADLNAALTVTANYFSNGSNTGYLKGLKTQLTNGIPSGGHHFVIEPKYTGTIAVTFSIHSDDKSVIAAEQDGTPIEEFGPCVKDQVYTLNFHVIANNTYYVYSTGTDQVLYTSLTYKIDITEFRVKNTEWNWDAMNSQGVRRGNANIVINHSGGLANQLSHYTNNGLGSYDQTLTYVNQNGLFTWELSNTDVIVNPGNTWNHWVSNNNNIVIRFDSQFNFIKPGTTSAIITFPGNDDFNPASTEALYIVNKHVQTLEYAQAEDTYTYQNGLSINQVTLNQTGIQQTITYTSSNPNVATVNQGGQVTWTGKSGSTVITASVPGDDYNTASTTKYTLTINGTTPGPRIVWVSSFAGWTNVPGPVYDDNLIEKDEGKAYDLKKMLGATSYAGYFLNARRFDKATGKEVKKRIDNFYTSYNQNVQVNAFALAPNAQIPSWWKRMPTDNNKPGLECYYYVVDDKKWDEKTGNIEGTIYTGDENTLYLNIDGTITSYDVKTTQGWKQYKNDWRPTRVMDPTFFYKSDVENNTITYSNNKGFRGQKLITHQGSHGGGAYYYEVHMDQIVDGDSLEIYANVVPDDPSMNIASSTIKYAVLGGYLQMKFEPEEVVVNQGNWIQPYLRFPDSALEDFQKIYVTLADGTIVTVTDMDKLFENTNGSDINTWTDDQINALCGDYVTWKWGQRNIQYNSDGSIASYDRYVVITGVRPKIWGLTAGKETDVTVHIVSNKWSDTGATCHVKVIAEGSDLFHFEMNDVNGHDVASMNDIGDIFMFQGDFIYMPGIVGNPNGNDEYSKAGSYKYLYAIQGKNDNKRHIVLNRDAYFYGEGVPNYYIAETDHGEPLIPTDDMDADACSQKVLIFKEIGLGNYYRNDSLMLYGHKPGAMYLYAEDAQTGWRCKPLRIHVIPREGTGQEYGKASLMAQKQEMMKDMSYPFTWDFEHMDLEKIYKDASFKETINGPGGDGEKIAKGNGGAYWRKLWDNTERGSKQDAPKNTNYYMWNGVFNADHDDKDCNGLTSGTVTVDGNTAQSGMRQRWFKDITANGEYLSLFKGLMINIAGLDYWQQKTHRFRVNQKGTSIIFVGGVHFMSLPGFGATGNVGDTYTTVDPTRPAGTVRMPHLHNQMNTNDNVTFESDFGTNFTGSGYTATLTDAQKRNNKVKFVIKARGGSNPLSDDKAGGVLYVGGKSMISTMVNDNGVRFSGHTDIDPGTGTPVAGTRIPLFTEPKTYVVELDPWSDEYQEQIYLAMDGTVEIFWMGITTEPRNMRSDHNVFTYSYPKDIDMDKTNEVMKLLTNDIVDGEGKHGVELKTYYGDAFGGDKMTVKPIADYSENQANYKFAAYEGVFVYPSVDLNQLRSQNKFTQALLNPDPTVPGNVKYHWQTGEQLPVNSGVMDVPVSTTAVTLDLTEKKDENGDVVYKDGKPVMVAKTDPNGHYAFKQTSQQYTYSYLPVYFVANAENQDNYNANNPSVQDNIRRGREHTMDAVHLTSPYDHWEDRPATPEKYTDGLWYNQRRNKLNGNPFSRWQPQDYVSETDSIDVAKYYGTLQNNGTYTGPDTEGYLNGKEEWGEKEINGVMVPRWITLNMTNKFMMRYLKIEENEDEIEVVTKVLDEFLKDVDGKVVSAQANTQTPNTGDPEYYYNLVGPSCVRFYRTFVPNYPKGRRASLSLTWDQYNTNTFGKEGMFWNIDGSDRYANFPWVDYEKAKPLGKPTSGASGDGPGLEPAPSSNAKHGLQMVFLLAGDGESMVSEDGGFPDSINGVTETFESTGEGEFYNLNGVRVTTPRKGVYIYNGRKVVIK